MKFAIVIGIAVVILAAQEYRIRSYQRGMLFAERLLNAVVAQCGPAAIEKRAPVKVQP
tara:strand:- start:507 stop:680 length:174 start_codon:yes stop_codon:yes gene_type:complete